MNANPSFVMRRRRYVGHGLQVCCVEGRNRRAYMEDRFGCAVDADGSDVTVVGVFDGHGGSACASLAVSEMTRALHAVSTCATARTLHGAVLNVDEAILREAAVGRSGSTCCCVMMYPPDGEGNRDCWLVNVGDSRCYVAFGKGGAVRRISKDHKPTDDCETRRVLSAGGIVRAGRIWGSPGEPTCGLNLSRSLGDTLDKDRSMPPECRRVSCEPQIHRFTLGPDDTLFMLSDGMYEYDLLNDLVRDMRMVHARGSTAAFSTLSASVRRQLHRADDNVTLAAVFPLPVEAKRAEPSCHVLIPSMVEGTTTRWGTVSSPDPEAVAADCALFGIPFAIMQSMESFEQSCPWPDEDAAIAKWYNRDNHLRLSEGSVDLHEAAFHAGRSEDCTDIVAAAADADGGASKLMEPDMWGNTPLHYAALRLRQLDVLPDDVVSESISGAAKCVNQLGYTPSAYDTTLACASFVLGAAMVPAISSRPPLLVDVDDGPAVYSFRKFIEDATPFALPFPTGLPFLGRLV